MNLQYVIKDIVRKTDTKIILLVIDGLGGIPHPTTGKTELEAAATPNLDKLANQYICGMIIPVSYGITPGSGPAHLALFGYDPFKYEIGRGVLESLGLGIELTSRDLSCRGNFATLDYDKNIVVDRRAGRIPTEKNREICALIQSKISKIEDVEVKIVAGKEHRFVVVFRGEGLSDKITENDPQKEGKPPNAITPLEKEAEKTASIVNKFLNEVKNILSKHYPANYILLRGFAKYPEMPSMSEIYKLTPAAIATYPMYKGLATLVGMKVLPVSGETIEDEINVLKSNFGAYDFFYLHVKKSDSYGEDGNFEKKVEILSEVDRFIPDILSLNPDVFVITGDHSTPSAMKSHSWHPLPIIISAKYAEKANTYVKKFCERECMNGALGIFPAINVMPLVLSYAGKLDKFGA
jgi:2,3-bisphosphoglycerate-independent phosphoglycerate mutase